MRRRETLTLHAAMHKCPVALLAALQPHGQAGGRALPINRVDAAPTRAGGTSADANGEGDAKPRGRRGTQPAPGATLAINAPTIPRWIRPSDEICRGCAAADHSDRLSLHWIIPERPMLRSVCRIPPTPGSFSNTGASGATVEAV
eukprot:1194332-Prorocentrum_minimum.AAC.3